MNWLAFFSQTGSEIVELSKILGRVPNLLVTNNFENTIPYHPDIHTLGSVIQSATHDLQMNYFRYQTLLKPDETLITLHGYLRIIPEDICNKYDIWNGHPGLINVYPELKGKDPQVRAWEGNYPTIGSVIHKVTPGVDEGPISCFVATENTASSLDEMYGLLKQTSLQSWVEFMKEKLK